MTDILDEIEWAVDTIRDRLMFGMEEAPLQAAYFREKRAKGILIDCKKEIEKLRSELNKYQQHSEILNYIKENEQDVYDWALEHCK
mgnify:CR=1 FL=1